MTEHPQWADGETGLTHLQSDEKSLIYSEIK